MNAYLFFAQERKVKKNLKRLGVGSEHDELGNTTIQGFGSWTTMRDDALHID